MTTEPTTIVPDLRDIELVARMMCGDACPMADTGGCKCPEWRSYVGKASARLRLSVRYGVPGMRREDILAEYARLIAKGSPFEACEWKRIAVLRKMLGLDEL